MAYHFEGMEAAKRVGLRSNVILGRSNVILRWRRLQTFLNTNGNSKCDQVNCQNIELTKSRS